MTLFIEKLFKLFGGHGKSPKLTKKGTTDPLENSSGAKSLVEWTLGHYGISRKRSTFDLCRLWSPAISCDFMGQEDLPRGKLKI